MRLKDGFFRFVYAAGARDHNLCVRQMPKWFYIALLALAIATAAGILRIDQAREAHKAHFDSDRAKIGGDKTYGRP